MFRAGEHMLHFHCQYPMREEQDFRPDIVTSGQEN